MYPPLHYRSSQSLKPTTKNEDRNEDCFLSINILFPSTKLSLTKPDPKPTLKEFFLSTLIWN